MTKRHLQEVTTTVSGGMLKIVNGEPLDMLLRTSIEIQLRKLEADIRVDLAVADALQGSADDRYGSAAAKQMKVNKLRAQLEAY